MVASLVFSLVIGLAVIVRSSDRKDFLWNSNDRVKFFGKCYYFRNGSLGCSELTDFP